MKASEIVVKWIYRKHLDLTEREVELLLADMIDMLSNEIGTDMDVTQALLNGLDAIVNSETKLDIVKDFMAEYDEELEILQRAAERTS